MSVGLNQILIASAALLAIGAFAMVARRNLLITLFGGQFMLLAGAIAFVAFGHFSVVGGRSGIGSHEIIGGTMAMFAGATALAELAIGFAMALTLYRERRSFLVDTERG